MKVVVHNADGVNPYGTEIAALLQSRGHSVVLVDASNAQHAPPEGVVWRRLLPANFGPRTKIAQMGRLARGLSATLWAGARGHLVLVTSVQFPAENLCLAALAAWGRSLLHVQHDPIRRRSESRISRMGRSQILLRSTLAVVHSERLRAQVAEAAQDHVIVCPHPPYTVTARALEDSVETPDGLQWLAFIGTLRKDKGIELVPEILARVPEPARRGLGLVICGRGEVRSETWQRLRGLGITVRDMTSSEPVPHQTLVDVMAQRPIVLAPYVAATQSGSVIMALSLGCRVIAFDQGGIPDVLTSEGLVPNGDLDAFAAAVAAGRSGTSRMPLASWAETAADAWSSALGQARARGHR